MSYDRITIIFRSGEVQSYDKGTWDDYSYDGHAVIVKKDGAWIAIYNFDNVWSVQLEGPSDD